MKFVNAAAAQAVIVSLSVMDAVLFLTLIVPTS